MIRGEIGDYITIARRSGEDWYIGSMTDESARTLEIPLEFLRDDRQYTATIYADGPGADAIINPSPIVIKKQEVTNVDTLRAAMAPGGGCAIKLALVGE